ncbi:MAG: aldo/keto reductase [Rhizobiaceae bacterium]|nr:aldo/keto reductase [Rhizobiaceae bacterium]
MVAARKSSEISVGLAAIGRGGLEVTRLGLGLAPLGNHHAAIADDDAVALVRHAYDSGVRYFDTAPFYGNGLSEARLGAALRWHDREKFALSTKVGRLLVPAPRDTIDFTPFVDGLPFRIVTDYGYDATMRSIEGSLNRLGLERIDIAYIHDIDTLTHGADQPRQFSIAMDGAFRALDRLRADGTVRAIGVGCNEINVFEAVLDVADVDCLLVPGLYTLLDQPALAGLLPRCLKRGVAVAIGSVFNSGILVTGTGSGARYRYGPASAAILERVQALEAVCLRHGVPLGAAALQFVLAHPAVATVIPGARSIAQFQMIMQLFGHSIPAAFWHELRASQLVDAAAPLPGEAASIQP